MIVTFTVPGMPVPKARARVGRRGTYTPAKTREYEDLVRGKAIDAKRAAGLGDDEILTGPVLVRILFVLDEANPCTLVEVSNTRSLGVPRHGDLDNMVKSILDGIQHPFLPALIRDDKQVVQLVATIVSEPPEDW